MISKSLSTSEKFAGLSEARNGLAEFCQVLYVMLIPHADDFGKLQGDPFTVKHQCFPASPRTTHDFHSALAALHESELIIWYSVGGKRYIQIANFESHQSGLHKRTASRFPELPGIPEKMPETPAQLKRREEKRTEEKGTSNKNTGDKKPSPEISEVLKHYSASYERKFHEKPQITHGKDAKLLQSLLRAHGKEAVIKRMDAMLSSTDPFVLKSGCSVGFLSNQWNRFKSVVLPPQQSVNLDRLTPFERARRAGLK